MSDYNVLTYAVNEIGGETDIPRCTSRAKSVYSHIKQKQIEAKEHKVLEEKTISMEEITKEVKNDMLEGERPTMGDVTGQNFDITEQNYFEK